VIALIFFPLPGEVRSLSRPATSAASGR